MSGPSERDEIAAVLAAHGLIYDHRCYPAYECECGWHGALGDNGGPDDGTKDNADAWRAHVADALTALLAERDRRTAAKTLREAADYLPGEDRLPVEPTVRIAVKRWLRDRARGLDGPPHTNTTTEETPDA